MNINLWVQRCNSVSGEAGFNQSGTSVIMSFNDSIVAVGAPYNDNRNNSDFMCVFDFSVQDHDWFNYCSK